jgi:hypothetical protein
VTPTLHEETQQPMWWVHAVVLLSVGASLATLIAAPDEAEGWWIVIPVVILTAIYGVFTPMTVSVSSEAMHVRFGRFDWPRWVFPIDEIAGARVVSFRPIRDYGGWGIRSGQHGYCLNERGDRGVRFEYLGRIYTVGSDDPERLLTALRTAGAELRDSE